MKFHDKRNQSLKKFSNVSTNKARGKKAHDVCHMILVAECRKVNIKDVNAHPLGPLLAQLANAHGSLRKTNMDALARELEILLQKTSQSHLLPSLMG